jgi:hypothetical protein
MIEEQTLSTIYFVEDKKLASSEEISDIKIDITLSMI